MIDRHIVRGVKVWDNKTKHAVEIDLDVWIDIGEIASQLAAKAYNNCCRRSRGLSGLVEVRVRGTKATPVKERISA